MSTPTDQNFSDYKKAEKKALEILAAMKTATPKKVDIEVALLVALFELHKGSLPPEAIAGIVKGHLTAIVPYYSAKVTPSS
jgi:response regulator RpfG family c-di-GMP phosphodiesterase